MLKISIEILLFPSLTVLNEPSLSLSSRVISCSALQVCVWILDNQMIEKKNLTQLLFTYLRYLLVFLLSLLL